MKQRPHKCVEEGCSRAYTSKSHLERHINTAHRSYDADAVYSCPMCLKQYANEQNLKRHYKIAHINCSKRYYCNECKLAFKKKHQLSSHMFRHTGIKPFSCSLCPKTFVTITEKKKHVRNHKIYTCEHCSKTFTRWSDVLKHKRNDHASKEYICHHCGKVFKQRNHIIRHVKVHMDSRHVNTYFCPFENCLRVYSRNSNLKQHIQIKHEGLRFDCYICGAKLSTKGKLNEHVLRHSNPTPYKAPKTLMTGRKKRKDAFDPRTSTALKLAGLCRSDTGTNDEDVNTHDVDDSTNVQA
ncbi:zinc finger protein 431-like isoform X2 [Leptidea sinapis]|uniref:zinc finger protein 431-like isoform X2 n=1 Tax=Leptidea sinapis TaxID=189913 RepID=UPI0021C4C4A2|nr:zinc finger protein 431-like isoform X2 [Leptidea sinapis]